MQGSSAYNAIIFYSAYLNVSYLINSFIACIIKISPIKKNCYFRKIRK